MQSVLVAPLHETADDPRAYREDQRQAAYGRALVDLLLRATGAYPRPRTRSDAFAAREEELRHARALAHWAGLARERRYGFLGDPCWQPNARLLALYARCGLTWAEVEEASRG